MPDFNKTSDTMNFLKWALAALSVSMVVGCDGGDGSAGDSPFGSGGCTTAASGVGCATAAASIDVMASTVQVGSGGDNVTITATVKDAANVGLKSVPVSFATT